MTTSHPTTALVFGLSACGALTPLSASAFEREEIVMPAATFHLDCPQERPAKVPLRVFSCTLVLNSWDAESRWLLLPTSLDQSLALASSVDLMEWIRNSSGQDYLHAFGEPGFVAIPLPTHPPLMLDNWELTTWENGSLLTAWLANDVEILPQFSLNSVFATATSHRAPITRPALLFRWTFEAGSRATPIGVIPLQSIMLPSNR